MASAPAYVYTLKGPCFDLIYDSLSEYQLVVNNENHVECDQGFGGNEGTNIDLAALMDRVTAVEDYLEGMEPGSFEPGGSGALLPPMSIDDASVIGGAIVLLWITAYGVRAMIQLFTGRV